MWSLVALHRRRELIGQFCARVTAHPQFSYSEAVPLKSPKLPKLAIDTISKVSETELLDSHGQSALLALSLFGSITKRTAAQSRRVWTMTV
jgi:hypothetical protein